MPSRCIRHLGVLVLVAIISWGGRGAALAQAGGLSGVGLADGAIEGLIATIAVGASPADVVVSPDGAHLYVAHPAEDTLSVVDAVASAVVSTVAVGDQPVALALSPDGTRLYVAHSATGQLTIIDTSTDTVAATLDVGAHAMDVAVSPDGATVHVALGAGGVAVVEAAGKRLLATIPTGGFASQLTASPDGARVYVAVHGREPPGPEVRASPDRVGVIDAHAHTVIAFIEIGGAPAGPSGLTVTPDGTRLYAGSARSEHLAVIDTSALVEISRSRIAALPVALAVSPDGTQLYVTNRMRGPVLVVSTSGGRTAFINGVTRSAGVAVSPDGARVYVTVPASGVVMVFDSARVVG